MTVERTKAAIFDELDRQHEAGEIEGAGYWNRDEWGTLDGEPCWDKVAEAAYLAAVAHTPESPDLATVEAAAARQIGESEQTPASLGQSEDGNPPARAIPEHGEVQSCAPQHPPFRHVEILVDGKRIHSILASDVQTHEDGERLTLDAERWLPSVTVPPNPAFPDLGVAVTLKSGALVQLPITLNEVLGRSPFPGVAEPAPDVLKRAHAAMTGFVELAETLANTGRGSCPGCQSGAHTCAKDACYCENPHRCGWPYPYVQATTTEGN
ncbi:hypothetical protein A5722_14740 [Mycobacterium vulneris]|nr:hypothetical protein A5722_14740 [Mycolicibacterium vulneris]OCB66186.1 hypothetical protein A5729_12245 [Mycolicibacterium vulneris]